MRSTSTSWSMDRIDVTERLQPKPIPRAGWAVPDEATG
jgi:hypothetical protein